MRHALLGILITLVLALAAPSNAWFFSKSFEDGEKAYDAGDYSTAFEIWLPLAEQGDISAQSIIALMYDLGMGVQKNYSESVRWYRNAAEQGHARSQYNLALMYAKGNGVPIDIVTSYMWLLISSGNGNHAAKETLNKLGKLPLELHLEAQARAEKCFNSNYQDCD